MDDSTIPSSFLSFSSPFVCWGVFFSQDRCPKTREGRTGRDDDDDDGDGV
jgi:hypothetical protein